MKVVAFFTKEGAPQDSLSPTITIKDLEDDSAVITDAAMSFHSEGIYKYEFQEYDYQKEYSFLCDGTSALEDPDRYKFGSNTEPNSAYLSAGGGLGITGDMIFELKKMSDNILTKSHFDKVMKQISAQLGILDKITALNKKSKKEIEQLSKMSEEMTKKIASLEKKDNGDIIKKLDLNTKQFEKEIKNLQNNMKLNKIEMNKLRESNVALFNSLKIDNSKDLSELKNKIDLNKSKLENIKNDLSMTSKEKNKQLKEVDLSLKELSSKISGVSIEVKNNLGKVKEDILSKTSKDISKLSADLTSLQENNISKFSSESKKQDKKNDELNSGFIDLKNQIGVLSNNLINQEKTHKSTIEKHRESREKDNQLLTDNLKEIKKEVGRFLDLKKDISFLEKQIKEVGLKAANKRDINFITMNNDEKFNKLHKKVSDLGSLLKNKLIKISRSSRPDDLAEVQAQIDMLEKE